MNRPLMEFLRSVPPGYQCHWEGHHFIPLREYCEAAADRIQELERQLAQRAEADATYEEVAYINSDCLVEWKVPPFNMEPSQRLYVRRSGGPSVP